MGLGLLNLHCETVVMLCAMVLSFAQLCDPMVTVILIADYKKTVAHFLGKVGR